MSLPLQVHFIIASCENMVHGKGLRPGDVLTSAHGKTVEVNNTDAEGRLTLADALWYAQEKAGAKVCAVCGSLFYGQHATHVCVVTEWGSSL